MRHPPSVETEIDTALVTESLALLAAFRDIRDPRLRTLIVDLVRALRPDAETGLPAVGALLARHPPASQQSVARSDLPALRRTGYIGPTGERRGG